MKNQEDSQINTPIQDNNNIIPVMIKIPRPDNNTPISDNNTHPLMKSTASYMITITYSPQ